MESCLLAWKSSLHVLGPDRSLVLNQPSTLDLLATLTLLILSRPEPTDDLSRPLDNYLSIFQVSRSFSNTYLRWGRLLHGPDYSTDDILLHFSFQFLHAVDLLSILAPLNQQLLQPRWAAESDRGSDNDLTM